MTLRIQLASDLHLEMLERNVVGERLIAPAADADLLVLVGDVSNGVRAIELFADWPVPVLFVAGNHEFYGLSWEETRADLRRAARGTSVVVLDNDVADLSVFGHWSAPRSQILSRVRFLGTTLWTDYRYNAGKTQRQLMEHAELRINDHRVIRTADGRFTAAHALGDHELSRGWLERELAKPFDGKTIVLTHHAPHPLSVHPRYLSMDALATNAAFVSDLTPLLQQADLWFHGHVHDSFDYQVGRCRVVANPRGYARNRHEVARVSHLEFENPGFKWACLIDIEA
jgi:predicted phosphodiesterase